MSQPTRQKPQRKPPKKSPESTEKAKKFADKLRVEINHHFGVKEARLEPRKLWSTPDVTRYRINWWDWDHNKIIKTAFVRVTVEGEGDDAEIEIKEITAQEK